MIDENIANFNVYYSSADEKINYVQTEIAVLLVNVL